MFLKNPRKIKKTNCITFFNLYSDRNRDRILTFFVAATREVPRRKRNRSLLRYYFSPLDFNDYRAFFPKGRGGIVPPFDDTPREGSTL